MITSLSVGLGVIASSVLLMWLITEVGVGTVLMTASFAAMGAYNHVFGAGDSVLYFGTVSVVVLGLGFVVNKV